MAVYTYLAADLRTNQVLDELPLHGVSLDRIINKPGNFGGSSNLDNDILDNDSLKAATTPGRTALYVYRDDLIVWGGIIWSRVYQSQAKSIQLTAQTFESYAWRRIFRPGKKIVYNEAQCSIIRKLWQDLQDFEFANIGVQLPRTSLLPTGDIVREMTVQPWHFKTYGQYIDDPLMGFSNSPEWTIECFEEGGTPTKRLNIGYPRLGAPLEFTELVLSYPGNILNYYWTENTADSANRTWATGDGDEAAIKVGFAQNLSSMNAGYPVLDSVINHAGVTKQTTIDSHARKDLTKLGIPRLSQQFQVSAEESPVFGTYSIGDDALLEIEDPWAGNLSSSVRVVGWSVTPSSSENVEEVSLVLDGDEVEAS